jgi:hypothetical protein
MSKSIAIAATAAVLMMLGAPAAVAQAYPPAPAPYMRPIPRIEINPRLRVQYYRDCVDGYVVEPRLTGPTVVPRMRCRWAKRYYAY